VKQESRGFAEFGLPGAPDLVRTQRAASWMTWGIRGLAARWGRDLPSYVALALNFYDFWHDSVMKLIKLGALSMDGEINYDLISGRARARCAGRGIRALLWEPGARASTAFLISPASRDITRFQS